MFLAHLIHSDESDVLLLSKVSEIGVFQCISGRPWEAVGGCGALIGSERSGTLWHTFWAYQRTSASHGLPQPPMASQIWPPMASHHLGLPQFVMWSLWANQGARPPTKVRDSASQTPGEAMRLAVKSVRRARGSYCLARSPIGLPRPHRSASQIWESDRPHRLSDRSHDLWWEAVLGLPRASQIGLTDRPHRFESPICEAEVGGRSDFGLYRVRQCI